MKSKTTTENMAKAIICCNLKGGESYALVNNVDEYNNKLDALIEDIRQGKGKSCDYLYFAFVSLASATLEYSLNFMLAVYCFKKFNYPRYENHLKSYIDISLKTKIEITPEIVSDGEYVIRNDIPTLQCLKELVDKRNKLMHNSKAVKVTRFNFPNTNAKIIDDGVFIPIDSVNDDGTIDFSIDSEDNVITTISAQWCIRMGNAIRNYRDEIVTPFLIHNSLEVNDLLVPCK